MPRSKRDSEGRFASQGVTGPIRDNPWKSAVIAAGAAAAGAFLWSRRGQIGDTVSSGMDSLSEAKSQRMDAGKSQSQFSEEAMTLKETGGNSQSGAAGQSTTTSQSSNQNRKAGAQAYS